MRMLDNLKPAWRMYKCQQAMKSIPESEILELLEEEKQQSTFLPQQWSLAFFCNAVVYYLLPWGGDSFG